jgi:Cysteine-rich secretory protein family.
MIHLHRIYFKRYGEVCDPGYQFGSKEPASGTLHFTQLIWRETTELGMGVAEGKKDGMTCFYAVARYRIRGNMGGQYKENVPKGKSSRI